MTYRTPAKREPKPDREWDPIFDHHMRGAEWWALAIFVAIVWAIVRVLI